MIVGKIVEAALAREAARKARELTRQEDRLRCRLAARQAGRLPGARSGQARIVPGRGRQRRRLGQAGPGAEQPGGAAAAGQDPERRAGAVRPDAGQPGDRHADHRARHRHRAGRVRHHQAALPQGHHHDRRRCGRRAYPHAAADLLLPADAATDRGRLSLHRPAAALQSRARQVRGLSQGPAGLRGLPDRGRAPRARCCGCPRAKRSPAPTWPA